MKKVNFIVVIVLLIGVAVAVMSLLVGLGIYKGNKELSYIYYDKEDTSVAILQNKYVEIKHLLESDVLSNVTKDDVVALGLEEKPTLEIVTSIIDDKIVTVSGTYDTADIIGVAKKTSNFMFLLAGTVIFNNVVFYTVVIVLTIIALYGLTLLFFSGFIYRNKDKKYKEKEKWNNDFVGFQII